MTITAKRINAAIKRKTGLDGQVSCLGGVARFYSDRDSDLDILLSARECNCIYVCYLKQQSIEQWVRDFQDVMAGIY